MLNLIIMLAVVLPFLTAFAVFCDWSYRKYSKCRETGQPVPKWLKFSEKVRCCLTHEYISDDIV